MNPQAVRSPLVMAAFGRVEGLLQVERSREILISSSFNFSISAIFSLTFRNSAGTRYCGGWCGELHSLPRVHVE
jgi:hypothetical protein